MILSGTAATGPDLGILANYGVLGLFTLILLGFGLRAWQREIGRADRLEDELREQQKTMVERVIPALVAATAAMEESAQITRQIAEERERELRRRLDRTGATE
jgi:hypothetical protein